MPKLSPDKLIQDLRALEWVYKNEGMTDLDSYRYWKTLCSIVRDYYPLSPEGDNDYLKIYRPIAMEYVKDLEGPLYFMVDDIDYYLVRLMNDPKCQDGTCRLPPAPLSMNPEIKTIVPNYLELDTDILRHVTPEYSRKYGHIELRGQHPYKIENSEERSFINYGEVLEGLERDPLKIIDIPYSGFRGWHGFFSTNRSGIRHGWVGHDNRNHYFDPNSPFKSFTRYIIALKYSQKVLKLPVGNRRSSFLTHSNYWDVPHILDFLIFQVPKLNLTRDFFDLYPKQSEFMFYVLGNFAYVDHSVNNRNNLKDQDLLNKRLHAWPMGLRLQWWNMNESTPFLNISKKEHPDIYTSEQQIHSIERIITILRTGKDKKDV